MDTSPRNLVYSTVADVPLPNIYSTFERNAYFHYFYTVQSADLTRKVGCEPNQKKSNTSL